MNTFRTISQTLLMTVLFVGNVSAIAFPTVLDAKIFAINNNKHLPMAVVFVANNCGKDKWHNKVVNTGLKTKLYYDSSVAAVVKGNPVSDNRKSFKGMSLFAGLDAGFRFVAEQIVAIPVVKAALDSVGNDTGKRLMRMSKEVAVGYLACRVADAVLKDKVSGTTKISTVTK